MADNELKLEEELKAIHAELQALKEKVDVMQKRDFSVITSSETYKKVGDLAADVAKAATELLQKAATIVQTAAVGAYEGAKKALGGAEGLIGRKKEGEEPPKDNG